MNYEETYRNFDEEYRNFDEEYKKLYAAAQTGLKTESGESEGSMTQEALKLALITLEGWDNHDKWVWPQTALEQAKRNTKEAITAIKEALAQRTERPVDCERCNRLEEHAYDLVGKLRVANIKLSMQSQRTWVGLTDEDKHEIELRAGITEDDDGYIVFQVFKLIEAKLKEKNA